MRFQARFAERSVALPDGSEIGWAFGPFEFSRRRGLSKAGSEVRLPKKSFEVLVHLIENRERVVERRELLDAVWSDVSVSDAALDSAIRDLRRALGDRARGARYVATYRGRGLRFVHEVQGLPDEPGALERNSWDAAAVHFENALRALDLIESRRGGNASQPRERGKLLVALARARWAAGATKAARESFLAAAEIGRRAYDPEVLASAALGFVGRTDVTPGVNREAVDLMEEALAALPEIDSALRAELLARLGTELYYEEDHGRSGRLTVEAVDMAERLGDPGLIAYVYTARHVACQRPEVQPRDRLSLTDRVIELVGEGPPSDSLALALQERLVDLLELGDGEAFEVTLARYARVVEELEQPFFGWVLSLFRGTRALLLGHIDEAEALAHETLLLGQRLRTNNAEGAFAGQLFAVRRAQGRLGELVPALEEAVRSYPALAVYRAGLAAAVAATDDARAARSALDAVMARDLEDFPRDQNWIATLGTLAPAAARYGGEGQARRLLAELSPFAGRMIVVGAGTMIQGAVDHHLGLLRLAIGDSDAARANLEAAEGLHDRAHAPLWAEETRSVRAAVGTR